VLILQLKRIGDAILTTPLLAALREHVPGAHLTLALDRATAALAPALDADRILIRGQNFWRKLAASRFDVVLDLTGTDRSALASVVSRAPRRITWTRFAKKPLRRAIYSEFVESSVRDRHTADHHTDLLQALGITVENVPVALHLPDSARQQAAAALAAAGISGDYAVIHPGTARPEKYWLPERWAEVITSLQRKHGLPVILTGSRDPAERAHLAAISSQLSIAALAPRPAQGGGLNSQPPANLAGQLTLLGTAAVLERARLLCAVDSAPVHLADALGTPVVALFGPTNPFHWRPRRTSAHVVTPPAGKAPMVNIETTAVLAEISSLLPKSQP
jgi:ADP-heptose:LPS heptosyltransferase